MERDEESGLQCHGVRYYVVWLGRWGSCDPIGVGDGVNRYGYTANHPTGMTDRSGLAKRNDPNNVSPSRPELPVGDPSLGLPEAGEQFEPIIQVTGLEISTVGKPSAAQSDLMYRGMGPDQRNARFGFELRFSYRAIASNAIINYDRSKTDIIEMFNGRPTNFQHPNRIERTRLKPATDGKEPDTVDSDYKVTDTMVAIYDAPGGQDLKGAKAFHLQTAFEVYITVGKEQYAYVRYVLDMKSENNKLVGSISLTDFYVMNADGAWAPADRNSVVLSKNVELDPSYNSDATHQPRER